MTPQGQGQPGKRPEGPGAKPAADAQARKLQKALDEQAERKKQLHDRAAVAILLGGAALALVYLAFAWFAASPGAFVLRDRASGKKLFGAPLTVVIQAHRKGRAGPAVRVKRLEPDLYGRFSPERDEPGEESEIYFWHVAYRPSAHPVPEGRVIGVERHEGEPSPEIECRLRGLAEMDPEVAAALKAACLRPGPAVRPGASPEEAAAAATGHAAPRPTRTPGDEAATPPVDGQAADAAARALETLLGAPGPDDVRKAYARLDELLERDPKTAPLRSTPALDAAVTKGLSGVARFELTHRLIRISGAIWHGTARVPPAFVGLDDVVTAWPRGEREDLAVACARIGGDIAARELARLIRDGKVPPDGRWLAVAHGASRPVIRKALDEALPKARAGSPPETRLRSAITALAAASGGTHGGTGHGEGE